MNPAQADVKSTVKGKKLLTCSLGKREYFELLLISVCKNSTPRKRSALYST